MDWKHGYFADGGYTFGYYPETMPSRLHFAALLQGHKTPADKFRYLDAGCGQGLNLILAAACHPNSEFVGVDFLPEHIAHANALAQSCGLSNITFVEGDFVELASQPQRYGQFDYAVCHGITTWIAPPVKEALFRWVGQVLKPGGMFYNSYNTYPGWLAAVPFQHLVLLEQRSKTGALALAAARKSMASLKESAPAMFHALPGLESRLQGMDKQDPAYLVQEYNNKFWRPVFVTEMMDAMAAVKLGYLGTATLPEALDSAVSAPVRELLNAQTDASVREQLRDYALTQSFRRDLYVKGRVKPWAAESESLLRGLRFIRNPLVARPEAEQPYAIKAGSLEINGAHGYYSGLLEQIEPHKDGLTLGALADAQTSAQSRAGLLQALSMLLHGGWVSLCEAQSQAQAAKKANRTFIESALQGAPYRYLALPKTQSALSVSDTEWIMLALALKKIPQEQWPALVQQDLQAKGRSLVKNGQPLTEQSEIEAMLKQGAQEFASKKLPFLRDCAAL